jgi:aspartate-semialdehyde dehydrogenase
MKQYNVVVVGIGAVGTEMVRLLRKRNFPCKSLTILARSERVETIDGENYQVKVAAPEAFDGMDFAFSRGPKARRAHHRPSAGRRSSAAAS